METILLLIFYITFVLNILVDRTYQVFDAVAGER